MIRRTFIALAAASAMATSVFAGGHGPNDIVDIGNVVAGQLGPFW